MATNISFSTYGFMNGILILSEENWRRFFKPFITDSVQNGLATIAGANMTVYVSAGECRCGAVMGILDEMIALDIANGDSTYDRIDSVIVQYTYGEPSTLAVAIVQGTPSANPVPPTLTKVYDTLWQMEIAQILVPSGATSSSEFTITDKRVIYESIESIIDDNTESEERIWSSQKTREEIVSLSTEIYDSLNTKADVIERTVSGDIVTITDGGDNLPVKELVVGIEPVQEGTGDPSPENVRPISGWDEAVVTRTGKNAYPILINQDHFKSNSSGSLTRNDDGSITVNCKDNTTNSGIYATTSLSSCVMAKTYAELRKHNTDVVISFMVYANQTAKIKIQSGTSYIFDVSTTPIKLSLVNALPTFYTPNSAYTNLTFTIYDLQLELGSTATAFEPYRGTSVTIDLDGTRYGGTVNVLTGEMTVDRKYEEYDGSSDESWKAETTSVGRNFYISVPDAEPSQGGSAFADITRTNYMQISDNIGAKSGRFFISAYKNLNCTMGTLLNISEASDWKTYLSNHPLQIVYELETPLTVQLTPSQMQTLVGENHIFANTENILNLTYRTDTKKYIEQKVADTNRKTCEMMTIVTDKMIAPNNLVIGDLVIVNNDLYKATANIASGATMMVGTNVQKLTLAEYIQSLL